MNIKENGHPFTRPLNLNAKRTLLPEFIELLNAEVNKNGRILTSISLNGVLLSLNNLSPETWVTENDQVDFQTKTFQETVQQGFQEALTLTESFKNQIEKRNLKKRNKK